MDARHARHHRHIDRFLEFLVLAAVVAVLIVGGLRAARAAEILPSLVIGEPTARMVEVMSCDTHQQITSAFRVAVAGDDEQTKSVLQALNHEHNALGEPVCGRVTVVLLPLASYEHGQVSVQGVSMPAVVVRYVAAAGPGGHLRVLWGLFTGVHIVERSEE